MAADLERDISEVLLNDKAGVERRRLEDDLVSGRNLLKSRLDRGVAQDEFRKGQSLLAAYDAALRGLEKSWQKHHGA